MVSRLSPREARARGADRLRQVCFTMVFEKCDPEETGEISEASFQRLMAIHGVNKNAAVEVFRKVASSGKCVGRYGYMDVICLGSVPCRQCQPSNLLAIC